VADYQPTKSVEASLAHQVPVVANADEELLLSAQHPGNLSGKPKGSTNTAKKDLKHCQQVAKD